MRFRSLPGEIRSILSPIPFWRFRRLFSSSADAFDFELQATALLEKLSRVYKVNVAGLNNEAPGEEGLVQPQMGLPARQRLLQRLEKLGLRHRAIDYDIESVETNVRYRVVFGEFPALHPYPGTEVTQYTIDVGAFDGDFESLHQNYQTESPFRCFTPQEKREQVNLSLLGLVLLLTPSLGPKLGGWLRKVTYRSLIQKPWTRLYFCMYFLSKAYP